MCVWSRLPSESQRALTRSLAVNVIRMLLVAGVEFRWMMMVDPPFVVLSLVTSHGIKALLQSSDGSSIDQRPLSSTQTVRRTAAHAYCVAL